MLTTPPPDFDHKKGYEIRTKHKEAIRQLYTFGKVSVKAIANRYKLGESTVRHVLNYAVPERVRISRIGRAKMLSDKKLDEIIQFISTSWAHRIMTWEEIVKEMDLKYTVITLQNRMHQKGYYKSTACQKPFLTLTQVSNRWL